MSKNTFKISALLFLTLVFSVSADTECDLNHYGGDNNSFAKVGATEWLHVIRKDPNGFTLGQPCEFNFLKSINTNNDYNHAYFIGHHIGANSDNHFDYKFSLKELDTMLSDLQPRQEIDFFMVGRSVASGPDKVLLKASIADNKSGFWRIKLFWNPHPLNQNFEVINIPKNINNECQCAEVRFDWFRMLPQINKYKVRLSIHNTVKEKTLYYTAVPNLTKLGYISSNFDLSVGNTMHFGTIKN